MTTEQILKEQVAALEKLLEIKDNIIASLQPQPPTITGAWFVHPDNSTFIRAPYTVASTIDQSRFNQS